MIILANFWDFKISLDNCIQYHVISYCAQAEYHAIKCGITVEHQVSGILKIYMNIIIKYNNNK
jgi:hypothetical protein